MAPSLSALFTDCKLCATAALMSLSRSLAPLVPFRFDGDGRWLPSCFILHFIQAEAERKRVLLAADGRIEFKVEGWAPGLADEASVRRKTALFVCYVSL